MPITPDRSPGPLNEEGIYLESTSLATVEGEVRYSAGRFSYYDSSGEFNPRGGLPNPTEVGQLLFSYDGSTLALVKPVVSDKGFTLTSDAGNMIVVET